MAVTYEYVGKTGGGGKPVDYVLSTPSTSYTLELPDGEWGVSINFGTNNGGSSGGSTIRVNGEEVADIRGSSTIYSNAPLSAVLRHRTGTLQISSSNSDIPIRTITAFPDPA